MNLRRASGGFAQRQKGKGGRLAGSAPMTIRKVLRRRLILLMVGHLLSIVPIGLLVYALGEPKWLMAIFVLPFFSTMIALHFFVVCPNCRQ
ncbi:MAG: hypothetical protein AB7P20_26265, partial [Rhizobiaceae bacterium]